MAAGVRDHRGETADRPEDRCPVDPLGSSGVARTEDGDEMTGVVVLLYVEYAAICARVLIPLSYRFHRWICP